MANTKVFVSPGVYTSEVDLSFVSQSVGVTTLGIVGETLKGPAFEPIFIRNFDEFTAFSVVHLLKNLLTHKYQNMRHHILQRLICNNPTNYL